MADVNLKFVLFKFNSILYLMEDGQMENQVEMAIEIMM